MREKTGPWLPALLCAALAVIVTVGNLVSAYLGGVNNACTSSFIIFLPLCFFHVGVYLAKLSTENAELLERLNDLAEKNAAK